MPTRASQICRVPGCGALCDDGYCERHRTARIRRPYGEARAARLYDRRRWRDRLRKLVLARDPLCKIAVKCDGLVPSVEVDHIVPRARGGDDSMENLQGACRPCHSWKTATQDSSFARLAGIG